MDAEIRTLAARLAAAQVLRRDDPMVRRVLTDELFYQQLGERLAAVGLEFVDHPYAEHVSVRLAREQEQAVFGGEETWLSNNLGLARDQIALLVVLWALLILPKRQRQIERKSSRDSNSQSEMFATDKPIPTGAELGIGVNENTLLADFGDRLGGKTRISIGLGVLSRHRLIDRRGGQIVEGPLLDLALDYERMADRVLDGTLTDLFGTQLADVLPADGSPASDAPYLTD